jgi:hypothetical protein
MTLNVTTLDPQKVTALKIVGPGVLYKDSQVIELKDIYISPQENNHARVKTKDAYQVQQLRVNFANGVYYDRRPPIVRYNPREINGVIYKWELLCGHHRLEAMKMLGYDRWIFWVYDICLDGYGLDDCRITLQLQENNHDSSLASSDADVTQAIIWLINHSSKIVQNTETSIRDYVDNYCSNMHPNTRGKVVRQVMAKLNTYRRIVTFTADDAFLWIESNTDYAKAGEYDAKRKKYGFAVLEGYEYEHLVNAMRKFAETGKESYFICRTKSPTKKENLHTKRHRMLNTFSHLENCLLETFEYYKENGKFPWHTEAFIPQDSELENSTKPILTETIKASPVSTPTVFDPNLLEPLNIDLEELVN